MTRRLFRGVPVQGDSRALKMAVRMPVPASGLASASAAAAPRLSWCGGYATSPPATGGDYADIVMYDDTTEAEDGTTDSAVIAAASLLGYAGDDVEWHITFESSGAGTGAVLAVSGASATGLLLTGVHADDGDFEPGTYTITATVAGRDTNALTLLIA